MTAQLHSPHTATAVCECGAMCAPDRAGHTLSPIRDRLSRVTPRGWRDYRVLGVAADGRVELEDWIDGRVCIVWQHADLTGVLVEGDAVALHDTYQVLAAGLRRISVEPEA